MSMPKLLSLALLVAFLAVPTQAQEAGYTVDVQIEDLPATALTNGTQQVIPFNVTAEIGGAAPCLAAASSGTTFTIKLDAELVNSTGSSTSVNVNPRQYTVAGPNFLPVTGGSGIKRQTATLIVNAGPYVGDALNATVKVIATFEASNGGCTGIPAAPADTAEATTRADFEPVTESYGAPIDDGQKMPGVGLGVTLVALAALALIARRK